MSIGDKIREVRKLQNIKQDAFNVSRVQLSRYENGDATMSVFTLKSICETLNVSSDYLLDLPNNFDSIDDNKKSYLDCYQKYEP